MPADLAALGLDKLTVQERMDLIETLWDSLPDQLDASVIPDWHIAEIAKRRADMDANPGGKPWRDALESLEAKP
jgi:putative addiction module component (TIGR02574 family)